MLENQTRIAIIEERYSHLISDLDDIKNSLKKIEDFVNTYPDKMKYCEDRFQEKFVAKKELGEQLRNRIQRINRERLTSFSQISSIANNIFDIFKVIVPLFAMLYLTNFWS